MHYTSNILFLNTKSKNLYFYDLKYRQLFEESQGKVCILPDVEEFSATTNFLITVTHQHIKKWYIAIKQTHGIVLNSAALPPVKQLLISLCNEEDIEVYTSIK